MLVLRPFEHDLLGIMQIWIDGVRGSESGRGFPRSVVEGLINIDKYGGASMWYGLVEMMRSQILPRDLAIPSVDKLLKAWIEFGDALGLKEDKERDRLTARTCSWQSCTYSAMPASKPLMVCKGCQETRYCSAACQKRYGHLH